MYGIFVHLSNSDTSSLVIDEHLHILPEIVFGILLPVGIDIIK